MYWRDGLCDQDLGHGCVFSSVSHSPAIFPSYLAFFFGFLVSSSWDRLLISCAASLHFISILSDLYATMCTPHSIHFSWLCCHLLLFEIKCHHLHLLPSRTNTFSILITTYHTLPFVDFRNTNMIILKYWNTWPQFVYHQHSPNLCTSDSSAIFKNMWRT